jgi:Spy/CpxP family protein refolding chaperone
MTDEQRQAMREKTQPLMQQLRDNTQAARTEAEKLLTADQVKKLADLIQAEMPQRGPRPNN